MAQRRQRAFAAFGAILFLLTSSALTIVVIVSLASNSNSSSNSSSNSQSGTNATGSKLSGFTPVADVTQLKITDLKVGTGATVKASDTITANYTGAVAATGTIFQSTETSGGQPVAFPLNQVIQGWTLGIPGMKVGGTRQLLIPASMAYGANPPSGSGIPPNAALVFDVTVEKIGS
jgi:FKBP-type peptidyl-prolyl cis-trans isomerase